MVVELENPANKAMHYGNGRILVSTMEVPNTLPKKTVYSAREADIIHDRIERDIYDGIKKAKPYEKTKFPMVLKILGGIIGLSAIIFNRKALLNAIKKPFIKK